MQDNTYRQFIQLDTYGIVLRGWFSSAGTGANVCIDYLLGFGQNYEMFQIHYFGLKLSDVYWKGEDK